MQDQQTASPSTKHKSSKLVMTLIALLIIAIGAAVFFWNDARQTTVEASDEAVAAKNLEETERVVDELGSILLLNGENPTVARVDDPSILQQSNPDFYEDIQVGDYLVLYPQRAIVYRSSEMKIINIAPIVNTDQLQQQTQEQATQPSAEGSASN